MKDQLQFREQLHDILNIASGQGNRITTEEVERFFAEDQLSKEQLELVYDYLLSQKIIVPGYMKSGGTVSEFGSTESDYTEEEKAYLSEYQETLDHSAPELKTYMEQVVQIAKNLRTSEVFLGDLIQEGNVSLLNALTIVDESEQTPERIEAEIMQGMQALIEEHKDQKRRDQKVVNRVNELDQIIKEQNEELGRKVTVEELLTITGSEEKELLDLLKLMGENTDEEDIAEV